MTLKYVQRYLVLAFFSARALGLYALLNPILPSTTFGLRSAPITSPTSLFLAKKRRRRKPAPEEKKPAAAPPISAPESSMDEPLPAGELPEFELMDENPEPSPMETTVLKPDEITSSMMGTPVSVDVAGQVKRDRDLEAKLVFDEPIDESIPDFSDLAEAASGGGDSLPDFANMSTKEIRKAKAIQEASKKEEEVNLLENIPFVVDEKGEVSSIKILEAGAWAGIFLLITWEIYINSPFFDRAAPMAPVVYELLM